MKFFCEYCGCRIDEDKDSKCPNCGASYNNNEKFIKLVKEKEDKEIEETKQIEEAKKTVGKFFKVFFIIFISIFILSFAIIIASIIGISRIGKNMFPNNVILNSKSIVENGEYQTESRYDIHYE